MRCLFLRIGSRYVRIRFVVVVTFAVNTNSFAFAAVTILLELGPFLVVIPSKEATFVGSTGIIPPTHVDSFLSL